MAENKSFDWRDKISPLEDKMLDKLYGGSFLTKVFWKIFGIDESEEKEFLKMRYRENWDLFSKFFDMIQKEKYCEVVLHDGLYSPFIRMSRNNIEDFNINGRPTFKIDNSEKITIIPVEKFGDFFNLVLFNYPQIEIPVGGKLFVDYNFQLDFSLGNIHNTTKNIKKQSRWDSLLRKQEFFFYGGSGRLFFRSRDALGRQSRDLILGHFYNNNYSKSHRPDFHMDGIVFVGNEHIYNGPIDSTGTFPFYLRGRRTPSKNLQEELFY